MENSKGQSLFALFEQSGMLGSAGQVGNHGLVGRVDDEGAAQRDPLKVDKTQFGYAGVGHMVVEHNEGATPDHPETQQARCPELPRELSRCP